MERHSIFLRDWHLNERAISMQIAGDWLVRCGHCGISLGGCRGDEGPITEIEWRHDYNSFFGSFTLPHKR